jgi:SAM-dependent methyltransferase
MPLRFPLDAASAYDAWRAQLAANLAQAQRLRPAAPPDDRWGRMVARFSPGDAPPEGFEQLIDFVGPDGSVLDIGAGAGRYAVPLAERVARVVAVDGSTAMTTALRQHAERLDNLTVLPATHWPPPEDYDLASHLPAVDVAFNSHVIYFVDDIAGFLDAMDRVATKRCVVIAGERSGGSPPADAFEAVHGEPLAEAPASNELMIVLAARGADYEVRRIPAGERRLRGDPLQLLQARTLVRPDTPQHTRLQAWLDDHGTPDERAMNTLSLISWTPRA